MPDPLATGTVVPAAVAVVLVWLIPAVMVWLHGRRRGSDGSDDGSDGGGWGRRRRRPRRPRRPPPGGPAWWPQFERQFAAYVAERGRRPPEPVRHAHELDDRPPSR